MASGDPIFRLRDRAALRSAAFQPDTDKALAGRGIRTTGDVMVGGTSSTSSRVPINWNKVGNTLNDLLPYATNVANAFKRAPLLPPPNTIPNVAARRVNYDNQRAEAERAVRGANAGAYRTLDENTANAVSAANLVGRVRAFNDISRNEANTNAMLAQQADQLNTNINAQNTYTLNRRQEDNVEAAIAQSRERSENLANAVDKRMIQVRENDRAQLDKDKYRVLSRMWANSGVADRNMAWLEENYPELAGRTKFALGGEMGGGGKKSVAPGNDAYYQASAQVAYYKDQLNNKLREKDPKGYADYFTGLSDLRKQGKSTDEYVQNSPYNAYLSPAEVKNTLGDKEYGNYLNAVRRVNDFDVSQGRQPLYGTVEGKDDLENLNYGRRFASLTVTPSMGINRGDKKYSRNYSYTPTGGNVYTETGDMSLRPDTFNSVVSRAHGGRIKPFADGGKLEASPAGGGGGEVSAVKAFYNEYLNSPNYRKRLQTQGYQNPDATISKRLSVLNSMKFRPQTSASGGSEYNPDTNTVKMDPVADAYYFNAEPGSVLAHEVSHGIGGAGRWGETRKGGINANEVRQIDKRNKLVQWATAPGRTWSDLQPADLHHSQAAEVKSDLDALRFMLKRDKIYDTGTQTFDKKVLDKMKSKYKNDVILKRMTKDISDDDLIYLMNNIAKNGTTNTNLA